ncbi:MAG: PLD nuclease N-terminal domain-containing protein [Ruminococcus sp.]|nr:PLD nuclease N-terminal domain-containing protein [Ruminococcus sp.]
MTTGLFIALAAIMLLTFIAFYVFICLYVYSDARVNSDNALVWLLITIFTPNFFGFLIYMLAGRRKDRKPVKKFKLPAIVSAAALVLSTAGFLGSVLFSSDVPVISNVSVGMVNNNIGSQWEVSYRSSGETLERTISLTDEELENFTVEASCAEGESYLLLLQGGNAKVIDLKDHTKDKIQLDGFTAGKIKLSLYNEGAKDSKIKIDW